VAAVSTTPQPSNWQEWHKKFAMPLNLKKQSWASIWIFLRLLIEDGRNENAFP
jgi:hypothetical protein